MKRQCCHYHPNDDYYSSLRLLNIAIFIVLSLPLLLLVINNDETIKVVVKAQTSRSYYNAKTIIDASNLLLSTSNRTITKVLKDLNSGLFIFLVDEPMNPEFISTADSSTNTSMEESSHLDDNSTMNYNHTYNNNSSSSNSTSSITSIYTFNKSSNEIHLVATDIGILYSTLDSSGNIIIGNRKYVKKIEIGYNGNNNISIIAGTGVEQTSEPPYGYMHATSFNLGSIIDVVTYGTYTFLLDKVGNVLRIDQQGTISTAIHNNYFQSISDVRGMCIDPVNGNLYMFNRNNVYVFNQAPYFSSGSLSGGFGSVSFNSLIACSVYNNLIYVIDDYYAVREISPGISVQNIYTGAYITSIFDSPDGIYYIDNNIIYSNADRKIRKLVDVSNIPPTLFNFESFLLWDRSSVIVTYQYGIESIVHGMIKVSLQNLNDISQPYRHFKSTSLYVISGSYLYESYGEGFRKIDLSTQDIILDIPYYSGIKVHHFEVSISDVIYVVGSYSGGKHALFCLHAYFYYYQDLVAGSETESGTSGEDYQGGSITRFISISQLHYNPFDGLDGSAQEIYMIDQYRIRMFNGRFRTILNIAGSPQNTKGYSPDGTIAKNAPLGDIKSLLVTESGVIYFIENNSQIRKIENGTLQTVAIIDGSISKSENGTINVKKRNFIPRSLGLKNNNTIIVSNGATISELSMACQDGYYGSDCSSYSCFGYEKDSRVGCSNHGNCIAPNTCECDLNYYGIDCYGSHLSNYHQYKIEQIYNYNNDVSIRSGQVTALVYDDQSNELFFSDGSRIYVKSNGTRIFAGSDSYVDPITFGYNGDDLPALDTTFSTIKQLKLSNEGDLLVLDGYRIRKISRKGNNTVTTIVGNKSIKGSGYLNGPIHGKNFTLSLAEFFDIVPSLQVDGGGDLIIFDTQQQLLRVSLTSGILIPYENLQSETRCLCSSNITGDIYCTVRQYYGGDRLIRKDKNGHTYDLGQFNIKDCSVNGNYVYFLHSDMNRISFISYGYVDVLYLPPYNFQKIFATRDGLVLSHDSGIFMYTRSNGFTSLIENESLVARTVPLFAWFYNGDVKVGIQTELSSVSNLTNNEIHVYCGGQPYVFPNGFMSCAATMNHFYYTSKSLKYLSLLTGVLNEISCVDDFCMKSESGDVYTLKYNQIYKTKDSQDQLLSSTFFDYQSVHCIVPRFILLTNGSSVEYVYICHYSSISRINVLDGKSERIIGSNGTDNSPSAISLGDNGLAVNARLSSKFSIFVTRRGEVYIADYISGKIRKIFLDGIVRTIAGTGDQGYYNENLPAKQAQLFTPQSIYVDEFTDTIYFVESSKVRRLVPNGCEFGYVGTDCSETFCHGVSTKSMNTSVCSGNGHCVQFNTCSCNYGYRGQNCEHLYDCFGILGNDTSVCSGNGQCISNDTCECRNGYGGNDCSLVHCNGTLSNDPNVCNSRGKCIDIDTCQCNERWGGPYCKYTQCSYTYEGYYDISCRYQCYWTYFDNKDVCSGKGDCIDWDKCKCNNSYTGLLCERAPCFGISADSPLVCSGNGECTSLNNCKCNDTYTGNSCQVPMCFNLPATDPNVCSGHGECAFPNNCKCNDTHTGPSCEIPICYGINATNASHVCSGHGECTYPNNCKCNDSYTGQLCEIPRCYGVDATNTSYVCSGHGICVVPNNCSCDDLYSGELCEKAACFGEDGYSALVCSGHGECISMDNCKCNDSYTGQLCEIPICYGIEANNSQVCSGHGECTDPDICKCVEGYTGLFCQVPKCFNFDGNDHNVCSGHGHCTSPNLCNCFDSYIGQSCEIPICYGINATNASHVCSGHGVCTSPNNCKCNDSYTGQLCEIPRCYGVDATNTSFVCSGHGHCTSLNLCICSDSYTGQLCEIPICYGIDATNTSQVCSGQGNCVDEDTCLCFDSYYGNICENQNVTFDGVLNSTITHNNTLDVENTTIHSNHSIDYNSTVVDNSTLDSTSNNSILINETIQNNATFDNSSEHTVPTYNETDTTTTNTTIVDNTTLNNNSTHNPISTNDITIYSPNNANLEYVNNNEDLILKSVISTKDQTIIYKWSTLPTLNGFETRRSYLKIPKQFLTIGLSLKVILEVSSNDDLTKSTKSVQVKVNDVPRLGNFTVYPTSGYTLETQFKMECNDWFDENQPLTYRFIFKYESESIWKTLSEQSTMNTLFTSLPHGHVQLSAYIYDSYQSFTQSNIVNVNVAKLEKISTSVLNDLESQSSISLSVPIISTLSGIIADPKQNNDTTVKNKIVSIISNFVTTRLNTINIINTTITSSQLSTTVSTISSISSSIIHLDSKTTSTVTEYFLVSLQQANTNNIQLSNEDFQTSLSSVSSIEDRILQSSLRSLTNHYTKVISIYRALTEMRSKSLLGDSTPKKIIGKVFKSYSKYLDGISSLQDFIFDDQTSINMMIPIQIPSSIVNVKTFLNEMAMSDFKNTKILEFTLQDAISRQSIDISNLNTISQFSIPFKKSRGLIDGTVMDSKTRISQDLKVTTMKTNCKYLISSTTGLFVQDYCTLSDSNDGNFLFNVSRTGVYLLEYQEEEEIEIQQPDTTTSEHDSSFVDNNLLIIGLSVGLPVASFFIVILFLIFIFLLYKGNRRSKLEKASESFIDGNYLGRLKSLTANRTSTKQLTIDIEMKENIDLIEEPSSFDEGPLLIPSDELKLVSKLGSGGFGVVYKAEYTPRGKWKRFVAIKSINDEDALIMGSSSNPSSNSSQTISSEALLMCSLDNPNIVKCFGVSVKDCVQYIVMEYVEGGSLQDLIYELRTGRKKMDLDEKIDILIQIAKGMFYLHQLPKPIVHRDLKPGNCLISKSMACKLCDFGLSKEFSNSSRNSMTNNIGTTFYMAHEIITGTAKKEHAKAIDVFSFSILMWELLFEDNPYIYKNIDKLFFEADFEESGYSGLTGYNILPRVMNGLRPVIPFRRDNEDMCTRWTLKFIHSKFPTKSIVKCLLSMKDLMEKSWQELPQQRPSFESIIKTLTDIKHHLEFGDSLGCV